MAQERGVGNHTKLVSAHYEAEDGNVRASGLTHLLQSQLAWSTKSLMASRIFFSKLPWTRRASNIVASGMKHLQRRQ